MQVITAILALQKRGLRSALVPVVGFNQQVSAAVVRQASSVPAEA
jgi:hypothetical protein